jgi:hypothetical protein
MRDRSRSTSVKRKPSSDLNYAGAVSGSSNNSEQPDLENMSLNLAKVNSICEKACVDICETNCDPTVISTITSLADAIKLLSSNQATLISKSNDKPPDSSAFQTVSRKAQSDLNFTSLGAISKRSRVDNVSNLGVTLLPVNNKEKVFKPASASSDTPEIDKFKEAVREAEKSTVLFNLNMGNFPTMNYDTISKKATLALTKMAANVEKSTTGVPSAEAISAIDDLLSVTKDMKLFGNTTKPYHNPTDPANGTFYTIPVKYTFKDRDTRANVEKVLRSRCNVSCSTPYPLFLRECIKQTVAHYKAKHPNLFVRVSVDISKLVLKIFTSPTDKKNWTELPHTVPIPVEAQNTDIRIVPSGFKLSGLEPEPTVPQLDMEVSPKSQKNKRGSSGSPGRGDNSK